MNEIIIRLCDEDRARLDRLSQALESRNCERCMNKVSDAWMKLHDATFETPETPAAAQTNVDAPETAQAQLDEAAVAADHPVEGVDAFTPVTPKETPTVKMADIQQKVVALSAAGKKTEVKAIVNVYAERVTLLPEDKFVEVYEKLTALEKGVKR